MRLSRRSYDELAANQIHMLPPEADLLKNLPKPLNELRVCVLECTTEGVQEQYADYDLSCCPSLYLNGPKYTHIQVSRPGGDKMVTDLVKSGDFDVFFNLVDGSEEEPTRAGIEIVKVLEKLNVPFTGAGSVFYEPTKAQMKEACKNNKIPTSPFVFAFNNDDIKRAASTLRFPVIVKHFNGCASVGMTPNSKCKNEDELFIEAKKFIDMFSGALIEEFITGPEFTCLVVEGPDGPVALPPVQYSFPEGEEFKHFELKWVDYEGMDAKTMMDSDPKSALEIMTISVEMFKATKGRSYGRCDLRQIAATGEVIMLEINPNCGMFYPPNAKGSADYIMDEEGKRNGGIGSPAYCALMFIAHAFEAQKSKNKKYFFDSSDDETVDSSAAVRVTSHGSKSPTDSL